MKKNIIIRQLLNSIFGSRARGDFGVIRVVAIVVVVLPASLMLSVERCDPGGMRPGVPPPELGLRTPSSGPQYIDIEELGGRWKERGGRKK